jgi:uncharacterized Fe-S cluster-containing protein
MGKNDKKIDKEEREMREKIKAKFKYPFKFVICPDDGEAIRQDLIWDRRFGFHTNPRPVFYGAEIKEINDGFVIKLIERKDKNLRKELIREVIEELKDKFSVADIISDKFKDSSTENIKKTLEVVKKNKNKIKKKKGCLYLEMPGEDGTSIETIDLRS